MLFVRVSRMHQNGLMQNAELSKKLDRYLELKRWLEERHGQSALECINEVEQGGMVDVLIFQAGFVSPDEFWAAVDEFTQATSEPHLVN
jgi:hypothetical protein